MEDSEIIFISLLLHTLLINLLTYEFWFRPLLQKDHSKSKINDLLQIKEEPDLRNLPINFFDNVFISVK